MAFPDNPFPPAFEDKLRALRGQFISGLNARLQEIQTAPDDTALYAALHRLAGAAGVYGFAELEQSARSAMAANPLSSGVERVRTAIRCATDTA